MLAQRSNDRKRSNARELTHVTTGERKTIAISSTFISNSSIAILETLLGGRGVAVIPEFIVEEELNRGV